MDEKGRNRHCWECLRRSLVCDFTRPSCRRCTSSGVECPGYGRMKPTRFKWLEPGTVISRPRRRETARPGARHIKPCDTLSTAPLVRTDDMLGLNVYLGAYALFEATEYFNACIYTNLIPITMLGPNPHIYPISAPMLHVASSFPDYLPLGMVCMALGHRINRIMHDPGSRALMEKFYHYRGIVIHSLNNSLTVENGRVDDTLIAGVTTLLLVDVQHGLPFTWRRHLEGIQALITLRGCLSSFAVSSHLQPFLITICFVSVMGNTTCPSSDLAMLDLHNEAIGYILECDAVSPFQMCPPVLLTEIIKINHIRSQASISSDAVAAESLSRQAYEMLDRVRSFPTEEWAAFKPTASQRLWVLVGNMYGTAVALYCTLSLQSLAILPDTPSLRDMRDALRWRLRAILDEVSLSPSLKLFMLWPLVVLGIEAAGAGAGAGGLAIRAFIARQLPELSRYAGTYSPLAAKGLLEAFWDSGLTRWDDCFDKPFVFTMQIAVDTSGFAPSL